MISCTGDGGSCAAVVNQYTVCFLSSLSLQVLYGGVLWSQLSYRCRRPSGFSGSLWRSHRKMPGKRAASVDGCSPGAQVSLRGQRCMMGSAVLQRHRLCDRSGPASWTRVQLTVMSQLESHDRRVCVSVILCHRNTLPLGWVDKRQT